MYIDNEGIVGHITDQLRYTYDYPYNMLGPVWDDIAQSAVVLRAYGSNLQVYHVKGHQDNNTPHDNLDLSA
eukprot:14835499-Ditylum_brightwellii.AAC.1